MNVVWLAILAAVLWGTAPILDKLGLGRPTPMAAMSVRSLTVILGLSVYMLLSGSWREIGTLDSRSIVFIALGAVAAGLVGQLFYFHALKLGQATYVVPVVAIYPLFAAAIALLVLREPLTPGKIVGTLLIVLGVLAIRMDNVLWPK